MRSSRSSSRSWGRRQGRTGPLSHAFVPTSCISRRGSCPRCCRRAASGDAAAGTRLGCHLGIQRRRGRDAVGRQAPRPDAGEQDGEDAASTPAPGTPPRLPFSLIAAVAIDFLLDGPLLGVGFAAGARISILLAEVERRAGTRWRASVGISPPRILLVMTALDSLVFVTAVADATVLSRRQGGAMEVVLSFGATALLYLVTAELLREAHEDENLRARPPCSSWGSSSFSWSA